MVKRCMPLPNVGAHWADVGRYPDFIWVEMSDGKKIAYDIRIEQPALQERHEDHVGYRRRTP
jgi:hypothetical protein